MSEIRYVAQYYESPESEEGPHATTPDEDMWAPRALGENCETLAGAVTRARNWSKSESSTFKTTRVLEVNPEDFSQVGVVWASVWERPLQIEEQGSSRGIPGETIKMHVWMNRELGPPDHWGWQRLRKVLNFNGNAWDLVYGREIDRRGKEILWSIRVNVYAEQGAEPISEWNWWKILGYDRKRQEDKVELIRSHEIEPRGFSSGVETVKCTNCQKTIQKDTAWATWNEDTGEVDLPFCSCYCIDECFGGLCEPGNDGGIYTYREDPEGEPTAEEDGNVCCEWMIEKHVIA